MDFLRKELCINLIVASNNFQVKMNLVNIRDVLTSFSPALDYLALSTGDGRIKVSSVFFFCSLMLKSTHLSSFKTGLTR